MADQLSFFSPSQFKAQRTPGDMQPDEWLGRSDVVFHGTTIADEVQPHLQPETHYGTRGLAEKMALDHHGTARGNTPFYLDDATYDDAKPTLTTYQADTEYDDGEDEGLPLGDTRVHARRVHEFAPGVSTDANANRAHALRAFDRGDRTISGAVADSAAGGSREFAVDGVVSRGTAALNAGQALGYVNEVEFDPGARRAMFQGERVANSWVVPDPERTTSSWEQDVLSSPNRSHMAQQFAAARLARGQELLAPIRPQKVRVGDQMHIRSGGTMTDAQGTVTRLPDTIAGQSLFGRTAEVERKSPF